MLKASAKSYCGLPPETKLCYIFPDDILSSLEVETILALVQMSLISVWTLIIYEVNWYMKPTILNWNIIARILFKFKTSNYCDEVC